VADQNSESNHVPQKLVECRWCKFNSKNYAPTERFLETLW